MAVPKRRTSKTRKNKRRASAYTLNRSNYVECPNCHEPKLPHRVCPNCGDYKGETILDVE
ncbi:50S ribosomal protein L32 [Anaerococcus prevotii]|uniref:Large ribosomal subunit protein bL32 n=1 Tax=Anaerococcus prevotii (strain ATCC 9321 / DSM 20548 / JCM 6508 / NCTC 11806 / PC1) TaxID=525919 RepID=C7RGT4_ANAPD|nr:MULTISPECIES: 50S ribosomal protein L32 [Anaerococcus]MDD6919274.1 50S ribosomal protein L32 [Peptoniphilaceae bacterium]ACV28695.1 ribosomal protein L32 [Anaerococcus prevotii DSM 20548]MCI5971542.1 50S ribosomal protein L32 [Anaerococcus sp.]MDU2557988.1 50S ribosomal protein L32 [Anaerococcus prevotii]MDU2585211.1 50S ribosomal protein L32 [Anaerococcus prevotii]